MKHKKYKNNKQTTKHSATRGKERLGLSKTETKKMANRAFTDGIDFNWTHGELYDMLSSHVGVIRYYANGIYIFRANGRLITVLNIDPKYEKNLLDYVSYPVFVWYKYNRYKYKSNFETKIKEEVDQAKEATINKIQDYFKGIGVEAVVTNITLNKREGHVVIYVDQLDKITDEVKKDFKSQFSMNLNVYEKCNEEFDNNAAYRERISNWFLARYSLIVRVLYLNEPNVIIRLSNSSPNRNLDKYILDEFKAMFDLNPIVRERKNEIVFDPELPFEETMKLLDMSKWLYDNYKVLAKVYYIKDGIVYVYFKNDYFDMPSLKASFKSKFGIKLEQIDKETKMTEVIQDFFIKRDLNVNVLEIAKTYVIMSTDNPEAFDKTTREKFYKGFKRNIFLVTNETYVLVHDIKKWFEDQTIPITLLEIDYKTVTIETFEKISAKTKTQFFDAFNKRLEIIENVL